MAVKESGSVNELGEFDPDTGSWDEYRRKMECYFRLKKIGKESEKRQLFLESCGVKTQLYIQRLFASKDPNSKTFSEIADLITKHQTPQLSSIRARYRFNLCERQEGETLDQFFTTLQKLAEPCAFGDSTSEMVRDRFICGVGNIRVQELLLSQTEMTMEEAFERAQVIETVEQHLEKLEKEKVKSGEQVECKVCGKTLLLSNLKTHYKIHTGERGFSCFVCQKRFTTKGTLRSHEQSHNASKPHVCTICNKEYSRLWSLKTHQQLTHATTTGLHSSTKMENQCSTTSSQMNMLERGLQSKAEKGGSFSEGNICETCGKTLSSRNSLRLHMRIHTGEKPWQCKKCPKQFTQYASLLRHDIVHTGARSFPCSTCAKTFAHMDSLRKHEKLHKKDCRPYKCDVCEKRFTQKHALRRHSVTHTGEQPYLCELASCGRRFSHMDALRKHKIIHTKQFPYQCGECGAGFIQSISLRRHMLKKHKLKEMDNDGKEKEITLTVNRRARSRHVVKSAEIDLKDLFVMKTDVKSMVKGQEELQNNHVLFVKCDQGKLLGEDVAIWKPLEVIPQGKKILLPKNNPSNDVAAELKLAAKAVESGSKCSREGVSNSEIEHGETMGNDQGNCGLKCTEALTESLDKLTQNKMNSIIKYGNIVIVKGSKKSSPPAGKVPRKDDGPISSNQSTCDREHKDPPMGTILKGLESSLTTACSNSRLNHQEQQQMQQQVQPVQQQKKLPKPIQQQKQQQIEQLQQHLLWEIRQQQLQEEQVKATATRTATATPSIATNTTRKTTMATGYGSSSDNYNNRGKKNK